MDEVDRVAMASKKVNGIGKVAVITGANAGIGFALAEKLLESEIRLCMACRRRARAEDARKRLKEKFPEAIIDIVILDTSSVLSVQMAAEEIQKSYAHIDYLYLNAGMMKVTGIDWKYFWRSIFSSRAISMLTSGEGLLVEEDSVTDDHLQTIFQTNLFGHYLLVKYLDERLGSSSPSQIIWTSSTNADRKHFSLDDVQHKNGANPYGSSKFAVDILSVGLNSTMNQKNVFSHTMCPGLVITKLTNRILASWIWMVALPLLFLFRLFIPGMTVSASNGAKALVWLSEQDPVSLDPLTKFQSLCGSFGQVYVGHEKLNIKPEEGENLIKCLDNIEKQHHSKISRNHSSLLKGSVKESLKER